MYTCSIQKDCDIFFNLKKWYLIVLLKILFGNNYIVFVFLSSAVLSQMCILPCQKYCHLDAYFIKISHFIKKGALK